MSRALANRMRAGFGHSLPADDPLDTVIRTRDAFWATLNNAAERHGLDTQQLCDCLSRRLPPGTVAITLRDIWSAAEDLQASGLAIPRISPADSTPAAVYEAERAEGAPGDGALCSPKRKGRKPRARRGFMPGYNLGGG